MSAYLTNKANIIISTGSTPTTAEINAQFAPMTINTKNESLMAENSARADSGLWNIEFKYSKIRNFEIELAPDTPANISVKLNKVQGKKYYLTFWDALTNAEMTKYMYTSTTTSDWYSGVLNNGSGLLQGCTFSAHELGGEA